VFVFGSLLMVFAVFVDSTPLALMGMTCVLCFGLDKIIDAIKGLNPASVEKPAAATRD